MSMNMAGGVVNHQLPAVEIDEVAVLERRPKSQQWHREPVSQSLGAALVIGVGVGDEHGLGDQAECLQRSENVFNMAG